MALPEIPRSAPLQQSALLPVLHPRICVLLSQRLHLTQGLTNRLHFTRREGAHAVAGAYAAEELEELDAGLYGKA